MQLAAQLKTAGLDAFPCVVNYDYTKQKWAKHPRTVSGEPWAATAGRPINDPAIKWGGCTVLGLPIPAGVVVLDLDTYKDGCDRASANRILGAQLPWDEALIQTTIGGGEHFAFRLPAWEVRQGDNLGRAGSGLDTRVAGKGFICSGEGYTPCNVFGVLRLAHPASLPVLPDACRAVLEVPAHEAPERREAPDDPAEDTAAITKALAYIDPTSRDTWRDVGFALKHHFEADEQTGFELWDQWSAGAFWADGCPATYTADTQFSQWSGFRAIREGATITIGTVFHKAMQGGWQPPARFDTSLAFGAGAAPTDTFVALRDRILGEGGDSSKVPDILQAIVDSGCNAIQALLLRNELKGIMKSVGLLDKELTQTIDAATGQAPVRVAADGMYGANDTDNAELFLRQNYPDGTLVCADEEHYAYDGRCWAKVPPEVLAHQVASAMRESRLNAGKIDSCIKLVRKFVPTYSGASAKPPANLVVYDNGILDLNTMQLHPHDKRLFTTVALPYSYDPSAQCLQWLMFLNDTLDGDPERIALLQEWIGYLMTLSYAHHKVMLLLGPPRCGKGTIGRVLQRLIGPKNFNGGSLSSFATDSFLDGLRTKPVLFIGDAEKRIASHKVNQVIERIKSISGNDEVGFDRKHISGISETLPTRITIGANSVPALFDDSGALASRLLVLVFRNTYYGREDLTLVDKLLGELPGIANWALAGLQRLSSRGSFTPSRVGEAEALYIHETYSPLTRFLHERCRIDSDARCSSAQLHNAYHAWCLEEGEDTLRRKTFVSAIKDALRSKGVQYGPVRVDGEVTRGFIGVESAVPAPSTASAFTPEVVSK